MGKEQSFSFVASKETVNIGRSSDNDFVVPLTDFSRRHCLITIKGEYVFIMDLGSKNGVTVDGKKIEPHVQKAIYPANEVLIANHFQLILPETIIKTRSGISVEEIAVRKR